MKTMIKSMISIVIILIALVACNEEEWLKETALDFYSPENSYTTPDQFNSAVVEEYRNVRDYFVTNKYAYYALRGTLTDVIRNISPGPANQSNWAVQIIPESTNYVRRFWTGFYKTIFNMNVVLGRIDDENINFTTEKERTELKAEAMFLRGFAYKNLGILYGGVPIILKEIDAPKRDFVRSTREETFAQAISDLQFAAANLPDVTELKEDGRLTKAAANHYLTELYIINKQWDNAINAASLVIDNPSYSLMTNRFGAWKDKPGDVFRDLFIRDNQNRNCNGGPNTEAIWVSQYEYNVPAGGSEMRGPQYYGIWYWSLQGKDGKPLFIGPTAQNGGRPVGYCATTDYADYEIWQNDTVDIRNSEYNIRRDLIADNPESAYYGQKIIANDAIVTPGPRDEFWRPYWAKLIPFNNFPEETILDPTTGLVYNSAAYSYTDQYIIRLAETYLLRAEAYLGKGNLTSAAADINTVRARAQAAFPVSPGDVDIELILDERARELTMEETRLMTLMRLGSDILVNRVRTHNPFYNGKYGSDEVIQDYNQLWPIPQSEIERNTEATLEQNPGYSN